MNEGGNLRGGKKYGDLPIDLGIDLIVIFTYNKHV